MCNRGDWRGFHTRYLDTPGGQASPLVVMEQCTSCGSYRAKNIETCAYVPADKNERRGGDDDGSVWGPDSEATESGDNEGW